jgi:hypothetical protein
MVKLTNILSELLIAEAIPYSVAKKYVSIEKNTEIQRRIDTIFAGLEKLPNAKTSKFGDRIYIPFKPDVGEIESPIKSEVKDFLKGTEYTLKDYNAGHVTDKRGRTIKLTTILHRLDNDALLNKVNSDKTREGAKKTTQIIVFSKHPYDIAGASTDRGWTSCMDLYKGAYKSFIKQDIRQGSFICYLTDNKDTNLNKVTARVLIKPFINVMNPRDVVYSQEERVYGTAPPNFLPTVADILSDIQGERVGNFKLQKQLYCDTKRNIKKVTKLVQSFFDGIKKPTTKEEVEQVLLSLDITHYKINEDLSVDAFDSVDLRETKIKVIPVKFGIVHGDFKCDWLNLNTLENSPNEVKGFFTCNGNNLTSLEDGPWSVELSYQANACKLTTLKGAPYVVGGSFACNGNDLISLEGGPKSVRGDYGCGENRLTSLVGAPEQIGGSFSCHRNELTSLVGAPKIIGKDFSCAHNKLKTLEGSPKEIPGSFYCSYNELVSFKGGPEKVNGEFNCFENRIEDFTDLPKEVGDTLWIAGNAGKQIGVSTEDRVWIEQNVKARRIRFGY